MNEMDLLGPVDYVVVEFPADRTNFSGEMAAALKELTDAGLVHMLDLIMVRKAVDGSVEASELGDTVGDGQGELAQFERDVAMVLAEEDVDAIGLALEPGSAAAILVWENSWAAPFGSAVRRAGGQLVASGRIPTQAIIASLEAEEQAAIRGA